MSERRGNPFESEDNPTYGISIGLEGSFPIRAEQHSEKHAQSLKKAIEPATSGQVQKVAPKAGPSHNGPRNYQGAKLRGLVLPLICRTYHPQRSVLLARIRFFKVDCC
jgi:hypothetical protein